MVCLIFCSTMHQLQSCSRSRLSCPMNVVDEHKKHDYDLIWYDTWPHEAMIWAVRLLGAQEASRTQSEWPDRTASSFQLLFMSCAQIHLDQIIHIHQIPIFSDDDAVDVWSTQHQLRWRRWAGEMGEHGVQPIECAGSIWVSQRPISLVRDDWYFPSEDTPNTSPKREPSHAIDTTLCAECVLSLRIGRLTVPVAKHWLDRTSKVPEIEPNFGCARYLPNRSVSYKIVELEASSNGWMDGGDTVQRLHGKALRALSVHFKQPHSLVWRGRGGIFVRSSPSAHRESCRCAVSKEMALSAVCAQSIINN
jgi:hypothetical protein